jgi:hypothetical protein
MILPSTARSLAHGAGLVLVMLVLLPPALLLANAGYSYVLLFGAPRLPMGFLQVGVGAAYVAILILGPLYAWRAFFQRRYRLAWLLMLAPLPPFALVLAWAATKP